MNFKAEIIADSIGISSPRLTTFELTYPRCIHSEFMTHRVFSRNSASSRAIPVAKMIRDVEESPFIPIHWGLNQKGMQASKEVEDSKTCVAIWLAARDDAVKHAKRLMNYGIHKQVINRLLEPWMWITVVARSSEYKNFFKLRCHEAAEPHMQKLAYMMRAEYEAHLPCMLEPGEWHLPYVDLDTTDDGILWDVLVKKSVARCARLSYLQQSNSWTLDEDVALHDRLSEAGHWSPFEHQARLCTIEEWCRDDVHTSNFGFCWAQYRKEFVNEAGLG